MSGPMLAGDVLTSNEDENAELENNKKPRSSHRWPLDFRSEKREWLAVHLIVKRHNKGTLLPVIERECNVKSVIHSDEWATYRCLTAEGFVYDTVNHQHN